MPRHHPLTHPGGFVWEDETPVDYTNWNNGEPTYATQPGYEDCVEMYLSTGKWNDVDCLNNQGYVCEQPKLGGGGSILFIYSLN